MITNFVKTEETLGYVTAEDPTNTKAQYLTAGSHDCLIDFNRKVGTRNGFTRRGSGSSDAAAVRNSIDWLTSTGHFFDLRFKDDDWQFGVDEIDGVTIDDYITFKSGMDTVKRPRGANIWLEAENIDTQVIIQGDTNLYSWNGAAAVVASISTTTVTKAGISTFAQNRFFSVSNKTLVNVRTGVEYTYSSGEGTLTLTISPDPTGDIIPGDILVQKVITTSNAPAAGHSNDTIFAFENQLVVGSFSDSQAYISKSTDYTSFTYSTPRIPTEGGLLTLDGPSRGFSSLGPILIAFAGNDSIFTAKYTQLTVGSTLAETLDVQKIDTAANQGSLGPDSIIRVGNAIAYLSNEVALRIINNPTDIASLDPRTFSNPIKPDFDAEDWTGAYGKWYKNAIWLSAPVNSHVYILQFREDADGKVRRFWQAPQTQPVGPFSIINGALHGHSNANPETYQIFNPLRYSDLIVAGDNDEPTDKLPISVKVRRAYRNGGRREVLKNFDEFFVDGEITANARITARLVYDYQGITQFIEETIFGTDEDILRGTIGFNSLAQQSLGTNPLGGLLNPPEDARKFLVVFEEAKEDYHEYTTEYESYGEDYYWAIVADGANETLSNRRDTFIRR